MEAHKFTKLEALLDRIHDSHLQTELLCWLKGWMAVRLRDYCERGEDEPSLPPRCVRLLWWERREGEDKNDVV